MATTASAQSPGYVAGDAGTILETTDSGASWTALLGGDPQSQERAVKQLWFFHELLRNDLTKISFNVCGNKKKNPLIR